jgi:quercetin 2,3-dioxygenase
MIIARPAAERGHADLGWLRSQHSFSFGHYQDPHHMGWGNLRVINEDRVAPGGGFAPHGHRDMEIISYVLSGALAHEDSLGTGAVIRPGEVQRMSAGRGIRHSEYNHAADAETHFLQIWILPDADRHGSEPGYEQKAFAPVEARGRLCLIASPDGAEGSVRLQASARLYAGRFDGAESAQSSLAPGRLGYVHLVRGSVMVNGHTLRAGDALKFEQEPQIDIGQGEDAEVLVFDLAPSAATS